MYNRDLGEMGESTLRTWAAQQGITANKANQDKRGWDFILEFPIEKISKSKVAYDKMINPIQCFVQVKATDNNDGSKSIKLSNWARMVKTPLPAFYLLLDFDNKDVCQNAYLIHVWEDKIKKVLKRLREVSTEVNTYNLNKKTINLKWNEDNALSSLNGKGLLKSIQTNVKNFNNYAKRKHDLIKNIGYESASKKLDLQLLVPDSYENLDVKEFFTDLSLGLLGKIEVNGGEIRDIRFGIPSPKPEDTIEEGSKIEVIPKPVSKDILVIRSNEAGHEVRLPTKLYVPSGIDKVIDFEEAKFLFELPENNNIILAPNKNELNYNINIPDPFKEYSLESLNIIAKLILFFSNFEDSSDIEIYYSSKYIGTAKMTEINIPEKFIKWATLIKKVAEIALHLDIYNEINIKAIEIWNQKIKLDLIQVILGIEEYHSKKMRIDFDCEGQVNSGDEFCVPNVIRFNLGGYVILLVVGYLGNAKLLGSDNKMNYRLKINNIDTIRKQVILDENDLPKPVSELIKDVEDKYKSERNILNAFNEDELE